MSHRMRYHKYGRCIIGRAGLRCLSRCASRLHPQIWEDERVEKVAVHDHARFDVGQPRPLQNMKYLYTFRGDVHRYIITIHSCLT